MLLFSSKRWNRVPPFALLSTHITSYRDTVSDQIVDTQLVSPQGSYSQIWYRSGRRCDGDDNIIALRNFEPSATLALKLQAIAVARNKLATVHSLPFQHCQAALVTLSFQSPGHLSLMVRV